MYPGLTPDRSSAATRYSHPRSVRLIGCGATPETGMDGDTNAHMTVRSRCSSRSYRRPRAWSPTSCPLRSPRSCRRLWSGVQMPGPAGLARRGTRVESIPPPPPHPHPPSPGATPTSALIVDRVSGQRLGAASLARATVQGPRRLPGSRRAHLPGQVTARVPTGRSITDIPNQLAPILATANPTPTLRLGGRSVELEPEPSSVPPGHGHLGDVGLAQHW